MKLVQIVFSPTGGTGKVADIMAEEWDKTVLCVYGNRAYEDTLVELQDLVEASGFRIAAAKI